MKKRILAMLLVLLMTLSLIPANVFADETAPTETTPAVTEPAATDPVVTDPVVTDPVVTDPAPSGTAPSEPEVTEPVTTQPPATEPAPTDAAATEPPATEIPKASAFELIMAGQTTEEMYLAMVALMETDLDGLMALTFDEIEQIEARALELDPEKAQPDTQEVLDTLTYLPSHLANVPCPDCEQIGEHKEDCPRVISTVYPVSNEIPGTVVFLASEELASAFAYEDAGTKNVYYSSQDDALVFEVTADSNDPMVTFDILGNQLNTNDYPFIAVTYRTTVAKTSQLFLLTAEKNPAAHADYDPGYSLITDNEYHTAIVNAGAFSIWKDDIIKGFRFDYFSTGAIGEKLYVDSIAFCKTQTHANYIKWERETLRGKTPAEFYAASGMELSFSNSDTNSANAVLGTASGHNVIASYDSTEDAVKLVVQNTDSCASCLSSNGHIVKYSDGTQRIWGHHGANDAFDPQIKFNIPGGVTNAYNYVVLTYMCKDMKLNGRYIPGENNNNDDWYSDTATEADQENVPIHVGMFPQTASGGYTPEYERNVQLLHEDVYYSVAISLTDEHQGEQTSTIRIDPFNCHFVEEGATLYLASIIFCQTLEEAEDKVEEQLEKHPYGYDLTFDKNTTDSVSNMPSVVPMYATTSTFTYKLNEYSTPSRAHYTFAGWKESKESSIIVGNTYILTGIQDDTVHDTLYAHWIPAEYTISYDLKGGTATGSNPTAYTIESAPITLSNPTRNYYTFAGWTGTGLSAETTTVTIPTGSTGNRTYTANWVPIQYTITYDPAGGSMNSTTQTYTIETNVTLNIPTRNGYTFNGWKVNASVGGWQVNTLYPNNDLNVGAGKHGNVTLTAQWTENNATINYHAGTNGKVQKANGSAAADVVQEIVLMATGTPVGAIPVANTGYKFDGWYKDAEFTQPVDPSWVVDGVITPQKVDGLYESADYYAKFKLALVDITITVTGIDTQKEPVIVTLYGDPDENTIADIELDVAFTTSNTVTIKDVPVGMYKVAPKNYWNWRYNGAIEMTKPKVEDGKDSVDIKITDNRAFEVTFGAVQNGKWLNGYYPTTN